jgi:hypothetical protein
MALRIERILSMPELREGSFELNFGVVKLGGKLSEVDRQCAWKLYTEIVTRVAVSGKRRDSTCQDCSGEIIIESFESLHTFFREAREIMKEFPVGRIKPALQSHLGNLIHDLLADVIRPFLEKWQGDFRSWWARQDHKSTCWFETQKKYPRYDELMQDWAYLRILMRKLEQRLRDEYKLQRLA